MAWAFFSGVSQRSPSPPGVFLPGVLGHPLDG